MKMITGWLAFVLLLFALGISELSYGAKEGSEEVQFRVNMQDFKAKLEMNENVRNDKIEKLVGELMVPGRTEKELSEVYGKLAMAHAEIVINDGLAEDKIAKAKELLKGARNWYDPADPNSVNKAKGLAEKCKFYASDIRGLLGKMEKQTKRMAASSKEIGGSSKSSKISAAFAKTFNLKTEHFEELLAFLDGFKVGEAPDPKNSNQMNSFFSNMEELLTLYADSVSFSKTLDDLEVRKYLALGNITHVQGKIGDLIKEVTGGEGGNVEDYFENMWQDSYDKQYLDYIMMRKITKGATENSVFADEKFDDITKRAIMFELVPESVSDGNPDHKYFLDTKRKEWFWVSDSGDPLEKHYDVPKDPYLEEIDDGRFVRYDTEKNIWLSTHPNYDGEARPIFKDDDVDLQ